MKRKVLDCKIFTILLLLLTGMLVLRISFDDMDTLKAVQQDLSETKCSAELRLGGFDHIRPQPRRDATEHFRSLARIMSCCEHKR